MSELKPRDILDAINAMAAELETLNGESLKNPQVQSVVGWAREQTDAINTRVEKLLSDSAAARAMAATHESKHFPNE